jgi:hypothetical protein
MQTYPHSRAAHVDWLQKAKETRAICPAHDKNIDAAISYYRQGPPDEAPTDGPVWFQLGKRLANEEEVDKTYLRWVEVGCSLV